MISQLDSQARLTEEEAAAYLGIKAETLRGWRRKGQAPRFSRVGKKIQYRVQWLEDYINAHTEEPISWP